MHPPVTAVRVKNVRRAERDDDDAEGRFHDDEANHRGGTRGRYGGELGREKDRIGKEGGVYFSSFGSRQ